ncbi:CLUMA_CG013247, isoform A [Clunio marinus]|uniref:CLUMA_CG013247, isoform A n=1 Tax=Clunio marinus TaxID=568069 RepID=A0A1J1ILJ9_9DIPT|nr:CLUMA_CG013247, isoform A [Clunio marinus]
MLLKFTSRYSRYGSTGNKNLNAYNSSVGCCKKNILLKDTKAELKEVFKNQQKSLVVTIEEPFEGSDNILISFSFRFPGLCNIFNIFPKTKQEVILKTLPDRDFKYHVLLFGLLHQLGSQNHRME